MNLITLGLSQMFEQHPIIQENDQYKMKYVNLLEYFVRKYSQNDAWAKQTLQLYIKQLVGSECHYQCTNFDLQQSKEVLKTKFRPFKFFTYRYCLIIDCMYICAFGNKEKGECIFADLSALYHKRYQKKLRRVFDFLYDTSISVDDIDQIQYLKHCWSTNKVFVERKPIKVMVTATMSAGKSTLLNALIGKKVNKTQNDACTAKIHYILNKPYEDNFCYKLDYFLNLEADYRTLMENNPDNLSSDIYVGTFFRTTGNEVERICLIDTPGVNSYRDIDHKELTEKTIINTEIDLLIYVLNGENIGSEDDRKHLLFIFKNYHGKIVFLVNRLDRFKQKEDSVSETLEKAISDLREIGFENPLVLPISAYAAYLAKMNIFHESLNEDEEDELDRIARKMKKAEYQFDTYFPEYAREGTYTVDADKNQQILMHSGILQLENIIYKIRK